ncbi:Alpha/Beta hydrolase protein [Bombardia bombarda]|uniref:Alpha/Beta hydrolase protein n=1 Tax=Bombardia bombarda TaxID=252184 RepID=A0AA40CHH7_9PEZI|nr:Alpha/Beta hydrolase protein [Bombardia bombarda]
MQHHTIRLAHKPGAALAVSTYFPPEGAPSAAKSLLVVFLNGLVMPRVEWFPTISRLVATQKAAKFDTPALLCYDRYGQGDSEHDPGDRQQDEPYGHTALQVVEDLHQLIKIITVEHMKKDPKRVALMFVGNSIGCALARLYAQDYGHTDQVKNTEAYLFLDSMMANTDFVSLFPDPDDEDFYALHDLPDGISMKDVLHARRQFTAQFHPDVPNPEHFDRRNLPKLLPDADQPLLRPNPTAGEEPYLVVIGHDPAVFSKKCEEGSLNVPARVIDAFVNPAWREYNEGLTRLVIMDYKVEYKIAHGAGHFIQKDSPEWVAKEIDQLIFKTTQTIHEQSHHEQIDDNETEDERGDEDDLVLSVGSKSP